MTDMTKRDLMDRIAHLEGEVAALRAVVTSLTGALREPTVIQPRAPWQNPVICGTGMVKSPKPGEPGTVTYNVVNDGMGYRRRVPIGVTYTTAA